MNRFLADCVGVLNAILAVLIIVGCTLAALAAVASDGALSQLAEGWQVGAIIVGVLGALGGTFVAVLVCGLLALAVDTRHTLRLILQRMEGSPPTVRRTEPTL